MNTLVSSVPRFILTKMPRKKSKAVPEGNGPVPQYTSWLLGVIALLKESRRIMSEALDKYFDKYYGLKPENPKEMRAADQCLASAEHDARRNHVLPRRQAYKQTRRLASVRRTLQQVKQSMGIAVLQKGSIPARRVRPVSA